MRDFIENGQEMFTWKHTGFFMKITFQMLDNQQTIIHYILWVLKNVPCDKNHLLVYIYFII